MIAYGGELRVSEVISLKLVHVEADICVYLFT